MNECKNCDFFLSSGFGMIGGVCSKKEIFVNKEDRCKEISKNEGVKNV